MKIDDATACWVGEYSSILKAATREGWLLPLLAAHWTPCERDDAERLLAWIRVEQIEGGLPQNFNRGDVRWRNRRGRARFNKRTRRYGMGLPSTPGTGSGRLRAGLVLHEAAHIIDRVQSGTFGHQEKFRRVLRALVTNLDWRKNVMAGTVREIYARHRGPYSLLLGRERQKKGGGVEQYTDRLSKRFNAEDAHEEARMLVSDPRENVTDVHVFSDSEGQFTGAFYSRGKTYESWAELRARDLAETGYDNPWENHDGEPAAATTDDDQGGVELPDQRDEAALLSGGQESVRPVDAPVERIVPKRTVPADRPVRRVPPQSQAAAGAKRQGVNLGIAANKLDAWPKSAGAQIVRTALIELGEVGITAGDLAKKLTAELNAAGVEFPASLISRLKQGGFIHVVKDKD